MRRLELKGEKIGRLKVVAFSGVARSGHTLWDCICDCGNRKVLSSKILKGGGIFSCGCYREEVRKKHGAEMNRTHGMHGTPEYRAYFAIIQRCSNPLIGKMWKNYGGRGIKICSCISTFEKFFEAMGRKPSEKHSIDRIDNNGDYCVCTGNLRWATWTQQAGNTRKNKFIEYGGSRRTYAEWARFLGVQPGVISRRVKQGWDVERILS